MGRTKKSRNLAARQQDLVAVMKKHDLNQGEMAEILGMTQSRFSKMINQLALPTLTPKLEEKLLYLTGKYPDELFSSSLLDRNSQGQPRHSARLGKIDPQHLPSSGVRCLPTRTVQETLELMDEIRSILEQLPERQSVVIRLLYLEGMTLEEAGAVLGITREAVRQRKVMAMKMLRELAASD